MPPHPHSPSMDKKKGIDSILGNIDTLEKDERLGHHKLPKVDAHVQYAGPGFGGPGSAGPPPDRLSPQPIHRGLSTPSSGGGGSAHHLPPVGQHKTAASPPNLRQQIDEQQLKFSGGGGGAVMDNTARIVQSHAHAHTHAHSHQQADGGGLSASASTPSIVGAGGGEAGATAGRRQGRRRSSFSGDSRLQRIESGMDMLALADLEGGGGVGGGGGGGDGPGKQVRVQIEDDPFEVLRKIKAENEKVAAEEKARREARMRKTLGAGSVAFELAPTAEEMKEIGKKREEKISQVKGKRTELEHAKQKAVQATIEERERHKIAQEEKRALQQVQRKVLSYISLGALTAQWMRRGKDAIAHWHATKGLHKAARRIQRCIRNFLAVRHARAARSTRKLLKAVWWRARLWIRSVRRRIAARRLRIFFEEFSVQQVAYIIYTFRYRVIAVQKIIRGFLACKRSRRILLEKMWHKIEKKILEVKEKGEGGEKVVHHSKQQHHDHNANAMGGRLATATARYKDIEGMLNRRNAKDDVGKGGGTTTAPPSPRDGGHGDYHNQHSHSLAAYGIGNKDDDGIVDTTAKGVDLRVMKYLVRIHLEERRFEHTKKVAKYLSTQDGGPQISKDHARMMLAGELLHVESVVVKKRPVFSLFKGYKQKFVEIIEEVIRDERTVLARVEERKLMEAQMLTASRYGKNDVTNETEESENEAVAKKAAEEEEGEDDVMTPEQEAEENIHLAKSFNTTPEKIQEVREMFQLVDLDHGGSIDASEFGKLLDLLGMQRSQEEIQEIVDKIDTTGQGEVFFPDFVKALKSNRPSPNYAEECVQNAFKYFAKQGQQKEGFILKQHLIKGLTSYRGKWSLDKAENTLHDAGLSQSAIDFRTYVNVMFQLCLE